MTAVTTSTEPREAVAEPGVSLHRFEAIGCRHRIVVTRPETLAEAARVAEQVVAELDLAASRFRADSEVSRLAAPVLVRSTRDGVSVTADVSPMLAGCLTVALHAARITDGLVDPTLGRAMVAAGYDADLDEVRRREGATAAAGGPGGPSPDVRHLSTRTLPTHTAGELPEVVVGIVPPTTWLDVELTAHPDGTGTVTMPAGTLLDLGATAKAHAADLVAARLAATLPGGFLVSLGGDVAVAGELPPGGWVVGVEREDGSIVQVVVSTGQALATSSTRLRTWEVDGAAHHHILDPRTGATAPPTWAQVTCAGASCAEANAASTAAVVLGESAPAWLEAHGIPARLDALDGRVLSTSGWPAPA